ncbi:MAG: LarC family nickel insertion protein [Deltaproteobacteria bacterium]|nr:LarC family nickel insertion protein [Deltaproteobacteria bacterium]
MGAHLHLDPTGGIAGDMFAAALLDLDPSLGDGLLPLLRSAGLHDDVTVDVVDHRNATFRGRRFVVLDPRERTPDGRKRPLRGAFVLRSGAHGAHGSSHAHVAHKDIVARIAASDLPSAAKARATDIFARLAVAEAGVHGMPVEDVEFHEVGAQDSIADIVTAAVLLSRLHDRHGGLTASVASLPLGSGRVQTAHGELPVPAPATLSLLQGFPVHDDGRPGERVTPTGAAIVAHLVTPGARRPSGVVGGAGVGFGTRTFSGLSNILRATLTHTTTTGAAVVGSGGADDAWRRGCIAELATELDDMTAEELAVAGDRLRGVAGVLDVHVLAVQMKKGRAAASLRVLCAEDATDAVARALFAQTTTLGIRVCVVERLELDRALAEHDGVRVKRARRPGGDTVKADVDDVGDDGDTLAGRRARRAAAERAALEPG